ncbi:hypothetical protein MYX07_03185 [Patescibacteria group bacterium AH-259-L07]|nr:hypothetical protein [Patescibacteria group bacterium AH-259-L07]
MSKKANQKIKSKDAKKFIDMAAERLADIFIRQVEYEKSKKAEGFNKINKG